MRIKERPVVLAFIVASLLACGDDPTAVRMPEVDRIEVGPSDLVIAVGDTARLTAVLRSTDGSLISRSVTWESESIEKAVVQARTAVGVAVVEGRSPGTARIRAAAGGREKSVVVTVVPRPPQVVAIRISTEAHSLRVGDIVVLEAVPLDADSAVVDGAAIEWTSDEVSRASVTGQETGRYGQVRAHAVGAVTIRAKAGSVEAAVTLEVLPRQVPVARLEITPRDTAVAVGARFDMRAVAYADGDSVLSGRATEWSSTEPRVATIDATGRVTAHARGYTLIRVRVDDVVAQTELEVVEPPVPVGHVLPQPTKRGIWVGTTHAYGPDVRVLATSGEVLTGRTVTWSIDDPTVASIDDEGTVRGLRAGETRVWASSGGVSGFATVVVYALPGAIATYDLTYDWWDGQIHLAPQIGTETVTDSTGAEHEVTLHVTGGSLTIDDTGEATYRRVLRVTGWLQIGGQLVERVARELVDEGVVGITVGGETAYELISTTTPGLRYRAVAAYNAGHLRVSEAIGSAPTTDYMYRLRP